jgi:hypothetical protein
VTKWVVEPEKQPENPPATEGLSPLDRDRATSLADEGGAAAASVEAQRPPAPVQEGRSHGNR